MFDGETYDKDRDGSRLARQLNAVKEFMRDGNWHTLEEIRIGIKSRSEINAMLPAISARLRDLRKKKFGSHIVDRMYLSKGLWQYRLTLAQ